MFKRLIFPILALVCAVFVQVSPSYSQALVTQCYTRDNNVSGSTITACAPSIAPSSSTALSANRVIKTQPGDIYGLNISADATLSGAAWWVMIYDAVAAPANGAVTPLKCYAMASGTTGFNILYTVPVRAATGVVVGVSTTGCFTKTESVHAFISADVM